MPKPIVAVVGRPNVGKSTIFNKIAGQRLAIVDDTPGVTRDRLYADAEWNGRQFSLVDTGGIEPVTDSMLLRSMREQALIAIDAADVIVFMTDVSTGVTADDKEVSTLLRKAKKPVLVVVNKCDKGVPPPEFYEFYSLGFEEVFAVSSLHGTGTGDLLDRIVELLPAEDDEHDDDGAIRVAVIGKPNAGKSSIINRIAGEERSIVSDMPGTTRDAVDTEVVNAYGRYVFIDTAGIRRASRIDDKLEKYSVLRAELAVERADVCVIMIDANEGVTAQDERIAGIAHNAGKPSVIVVNKWDTVEKDNTTVNAFTERVYKALSYMTYAPVIYVSAKTGQRVDRVFELINKVAASASKRITTGMINDLLGDAVQRVQPPSDKGRVLKLYYMTQTGTNPPTFVVFCNRAELFHFSYRRYIENCLRTTYGFEGTPIRLIVKQKGDE